MNINERVTALMAKVTRRDVSEVFGKALCEAKREKQRFFGGADDQRTKPEIMADCLLAVYRAGLYDGLSAAMEDFSDDGR